MFEYFLNSVEKIQASLESKSTPMLILIISRSVLLRTRNDSDKSCKENQNTYFIFNRFFFFENLAFMMQYEKRFTAGYATEDNMAHAHGILNS
jgi:hypothetical protein